MTKALLISRILDGLIYLIDGNITKEEAIDSIEKLIDEYANKAIEDAIEIFMNHPLSEFTDLEIKKVSEQLKEKK